MFTVFSMQIFDLSIKLATATNEGTEVEAIQMGDGSDTRTWDVSERMKVKAIHYNSGEPNRDED